MPTWVSYYIGSLFSIPISANSFHSQTQFILYPGNNTEAICEGLVSSDEYISPKGTKQYYLKKK